MRITSQLFPESKLRFMLHILLCIALINGIAFSSAKANAVDRKADAKEVVNKLVAEDYEGIRKNFNDTMKANLPAEKLKEGWRYVVEHLGEFKSQEEPQSRTVEGWEVILIGCQMERGRINVEVSYDSNGKIGGLWIRPAQ